MLSVPGGGAVAGFAGDAQLGGSCVEGAVIDEAGIAGCAVALDAVVVPLRDHALARRCHHEGVLSRDPLLLLRQVNEWQGLQKVAVLSLVDLVSGIEHAPFHPVSLVMVRPLSLIHI